MDSLQLEIGLDSWITQDGNYPDFEVSQQTAFALEFCSREWLRVQEAPPRLESLGDAHYRACGVVRYTAADAWVIEFNDVLAFRQQAPPPNVEAGATVAGEIWLGVDPFFYFETLCRNPGIPPLIYRWRIDRIAIETAPFLESRDERGRSVFVRDASRHAREQRRRTDARHDDGGHGDYVLTCTRLPSAPTYCRTGK